MDITNFQNTEIIKAIQALAAFTNRGGLKAGEISAGRAGVIWIKATAETATLQLSSRNLDDIEVEYRVTDESLIGGDLDVAVSAKHLAAAVRCLQVAATTEPAPSGALRVAQSGWLRIGEFAGAQMLADKVTQQLPAPDLSDLEEVAELDYDALSMALRRAALVVDGRTDGLGRIFVHALDNRVRVTSCDGHWLYVEDLPTVVKVETRFELPLTLRAATSSFVAVRSVDRVTLVADDPGLPRRVGIAAPQLSILVRTLEPSKTEAVYTWGAETMKAVAGVEAVSFPVRDWARFLRSAKTAGDAVRIGFESQTARIEAVTTAQRAPEGSLVGIGGIAALGAGDGAWALNARFLEGAVNLMRDRPRDEADDSDDEDGDIVTVARTNIDQGQQVMEVFLVTRRDDPHRRVFCVPVRPTEVPASPLVQVAGI